MGRAGHRDRLRAGPALRVRRSSRRVAVNRWRFELEPSADGTTLTESFDVPAINVEGSPANFDGRFEMLVKAINKTIANIKAAAEALTPPT